jgi:hypothetical protein
MGLLVPSIPHHGMEGSEIFLKVFPGQLPQMKKKEWLLLTGAYGSLPGFRET